ncbi:N-acetylmuramoyl-L-alanine amidase [Kaistia dalseonensis]|uniref:N-acetylmuramoyl-L-alanine amidase n=1 Tax=Kaistia dalseonensis TaxID=410840 RepID=A0ABU0HE82_9HYPH|nr:N-acetylmuramoyl-L-alanine amidase [Kaistia dalseonensis]MCX5497156.1 N-acetylmuramoyl-L-alanine amidase [Kaistia dalseonensis]MDQ0439784.1 N-acetylmuramoyl-L-alanine amidase [Kaistia dalseonensis]
MTPDSRLVDQLRPSPNFGPRAEGKPIDILILHYTDMASAEAAIDLLSDPASQVSCHYVVAEDGTVTQLVAERERAWHAGVSSWHGETDINSRSIGIEIANLGHDHGYPDFPARQIESVIRLGCDICARNGIVPERVLAHSDIAPTRKRDPGEKFPWADLAASGLGHFVTPEPMRGGRFFQRGEAGEPIAALQALLAFYGYAIEINGRFDAHTETVVTAFQRHFRPERVDGIADASTIATLHRLARALPPRAVPDAAAGAQGGG